MYVISLHEVNAVLNWAIPVHWMATVTISIALCQTPAYNTRPQTRGNALPSVRVYSPASASIQ